jgi:CCR4-NOT complex subunit CAF16
MLQLLRPAELLLLDEITTDLDLITRQDFLNYLRDCAEEPRGGSGGTTIVYATHIFDGLDAWPTHIAYVGDGRLLRFGRVEEFADLQQRFRAGTVAPLLRTIEAWLREDRDARRAKGARMTEVAAALEESNLNELTGNGYLSGRFNAGYGN